MVGVVRGHVDVRDLLLDYSQVLSREVSAISEYLLQHFINLLIIAAKIIKFFNKVVVLVNTSHQNLKSL